MITNFICYWEQKNNNNLWQFHDHRQLNYTITDIFQMYKKILYPLIEERPYYWKIIGLPKDISLEVYNLLFPLQQQWKGYLTFRELMSIIFLQSLNVSEDDILLDSMYNDALKNLSYRIADTEEQTKLTRLVFACDIINEKKTISWGQVFDREEAERKEREYFDTEGYVYES